MIKRVEKHVAPLIVHKLAERRAFDIIDDGGIAALINQSNIAGGDVSIRSWAILNGGTTIKTANSSYGLAPSAEKLR